MATVSKAKGAALSRSIARRYGKVLQRVQTGTPLRDEDKELIWHAMYGTYRGIVTSIAAVRRPPNRDTLTCQVDHCDPLDSLPTVFRANVTPYVEDA